MEIYGEIKGIRYKPYLCEPLSTYNFDDLEKALSEKASFILKMREDCEIAVSWWVSPKRTRSYPYARVYDTLGFTGKRVTIIPIMKDEGKGENKKGCKGDRDFLQWDTIALMSLLEVYVVIAYYATADRKEGCCNRITNQKFDSRFLEDELKKLQCYQSDALHWNIMQVENIHQVAELALRAYERMAKTLGIQLHSLEYAQRKIAQLHESKEAFLRCSRSLAHKAQVREAATTQPKEHVTGPKATVTIKNFLGGCYYLTCDEVEIQGDKLYLIECKHTKTGTLPSKSDIKDGLVKMILFSNLENLVCNGRRFSLIPVLKLTTGENFREDVSRQSEMLDLLRKEAQHNGFRLKINDRFLA